MMFEGHTAVTPKSMATFFRVVFYNDVVSVSFFLNITDDKTDCETV